MMFSPPGGKKPGEGDAGTSAGTSGAAPGSPSEGNTPAPQK
jgi:hypothetical protein